MPMSGQRTFNSAPDDGCGALTGFGCHIAIGRISGAIGQYPVGVRQLRQSLPAEWKPKSARACPIGWACPSFPQSLVQTADKRNTNRALKLDALQAL